MYETRCSPVCTSWVLVEIQKSRASLQSSQCLTRSVGISNTRSILRSFRPLRVGKSAKTTYLTLANCVCSMDYLHHICCHCYFHPSKSPPPVLLLCRQPEGRRDLTEPAAHTLVQQSLRPLLVPGRTASRVCAPRPSVPTQAGLVVTAEAPVSLGATVAVSSGSGTGSESSPPSQELSVFAEW